MVNKKTTSSKKRYPHGYKFLKTLGEGAFGRVDKAIDESTNDIVAIKFQKKMGQDYDEDYKAEIDHLKAFSKQCDNLVCIQDNGMYDKKHFIVMDFIKGKEMDDYYHPLFRTQEQKNMATKMLETHIKDLVKTVKIMHRKGFAHSDIKPQNIIIDGNDVLHLVDLGAACKSSESECSTVHTTGFVPEDDYFYLTNFNKRKDGDIFAIAATLLSILDSNAMYRFENSNFTDERIVEEVIKNQSSPYLKKVLKLLISNNRETLFKKL